MPVPTDITQLSTTASSNSPAGADNVFPDLDNYLRAHASFIAQNYANKLSSTGGTLTGVLLSTAGSASAPGIAFTGDANTGIWSPAADTFAVSTGGTERLRIFNGGGIATALTGAVVGTMPANTAVFIDRLASSPLPALTAGTALTLAGSTGAGSPCYMEVISGNTSTGEVRFGDTDAAGRGRVQYNHNTEGMALWTAGASRLVINNVGLITTTAGITVGAGQILAPLGTAAAPTYSISGDPNTGVFSPGADRWAVATAGVQRAEIDASGYGQMTVNGLGVGRIPAKQYYRLNTAFAGADVNTAQPIFNVGVTLVGSTVYEFEMEAAFCKTLGATSHEFNILFGGTATINNIFYTALGGGTAADALPTGDDSNHRYSASNSLAALTVVDAVAAADRSAIVKVRGTISINAGGTLIPQYQLSAAPGGAYTTQIGSYFSIWPLGASGSNTSIGTWA